MTGQILVPFDGSPPSERALTYVFENFSNASITTVYVIDPIESVYAVEAGGLPVAEDWYENAQERANRIQSIAKEMATEQGSELDTATSIGRPAKEILDYADEHDIEQIVMGSHSRRGIERALLGSVAERVTRRARIPVTIVR